MLDFKFGKKVFTLTKELKIFNSKFKTYLPMGRFKI